MNSTEDMTDILKNFFYPNNEKALTKQQFVARCEEWFDISLDEEKEIYKQFFEFAFTMADDDWWTGNNEQLEQKEFIKISKAISIEKTSDMKTNIGTMMFNIIDVERNGYVTIDNDKLFEKRATKDLKQFFLKIGKGEQYIKQLDKNGDNKISLVEFLIWFRKHVNDIFDKKK